MKAMEYLKSLIKAGTLDSSKSFALVLSVLVGALVGFLVWDVCTNGHLQTDLDGLGIFLLCAGGFMAGGAIPKSLSEHKNKKNESKQHTHQETERI